MNDITYLPQTGGGMMTKQVADICDAIGAVFGGGRPSFQTTSQRPTAATQTKPATEAGAQHVNKSVER
jgi:hypothetical protein